MKKGDKPGKVAKTTPMMPAPGEGTISVGPRSSDPQSEGTIGMAAPPPAGTDLQSEGTIGMAAPAPSEQTEAVQRTAAGLPSDDTGGTLAGTPEALGDGIVFGEAPPTGRRTNPEMTPGMGSQGTQATFLTLAQQPLPPGGFRFGKYHVKSELGRGGMGVVYRATDTALNREVAIKLMLSQEVPEEEKLRFLKEAEASAALKHPYIVGVHEVNAEAGALFFSMDYVEGKTFKSIIQENKENLPLLLEIFCKTCEGVGYAHRKGIIHRDLKPQNVMVDADMNPHVMDFGLARRLDEKDQKPSEEESKRRSRLTKMGAVMGTPVYMPPEQAGGRIDEVDTRSDIYSLGVILYSILTGDLPFRAKSTPELILMIEEDRPPPPSSKNPACPWELEKIVLQAIAKRRDDRYQTCFDLIDDIRAWLEGRPVTAVHGGSGYVLGKWVRRNRAAVAVGAVAFVVMAGAFGYLWRQAVEAELRNREIAARDMEEGEKLARDAEAKRRAFRESREHLGKAERRALLVEADRLYGVGIEKVAAALRLDENNKRAGEVITALKIGQSDVKTLNELEVSEEAAEKARLAAEKKRREDAAAMALAALERVRAIDTEGELTKEILAERKAAIEAGNRELLKALGLHSECAPANDGLRVVQGKLVRLLEVEKDLAAREQIIAITSESRGKLEAAAAARRTMADEKATLAERRAARDDAWEQLRAAASRLSEALRLDDRHPLAREQRLAAAIGLGEIALGERKPDVADVVVDEVQALDPVRVAAFRERIQKAKEDGQRFQAALEKAEVARANERYTEAAGSYKEALNAAPGRAEAIFGERFSAGAAAAQAGRHEEALQVYAEAQAAAERPQDRGDLERAIVRSRGELVRVALRDATDAVKATRLDLARELVAKALAIDPASQDARRLLDEIEAKRRVPPGTVLVGKGPITFGLGSEAREAVPVERFFIGKTEVTNAEFHAFVKEGGYEKKELWDAQGWDARREMVGQDGRPGPLGWINSAPPLTTEQLPVCGVSWYEARAYARWKGEGWRLPTELEWEKAALWDEKAGRRVEAPWIVRGADGAVTSLWAAVWRPHFNRDEPRPVGAEVGKLQGVPIFDASPYEAADMWGNVRELIVVRREDGAETPGARGGSFRSMTEERSSASRTFRPTATYRSADVGFRLARSTVE